jgi:hypothetical protein
MANEKQKEVRINGSGMKLTVSQDNVGISKNKDEHVKWVSDIDQIVTITFTKSPFKKGGKFTVNPKGATPSGSIDPAAKAGGERYKYSVSAPTFDPLDPNVIVDN